MNCPYCQSDSRVVDSRPTEGGIRRRRVCNECKRRFTTYERIGHPDIKVVKRGDRATEPFDHEKIKRVLARVGRDRAALGDDARERVARRIEADLLDERSPTVRSSRIAEMVLARLHEIDAVAHARLAANYVGEDGQVRTEPRAAAAEPSPQLALGLPDPDK